MNIWHRLRPPFRLKREAFVVKSLWNYKAIDSDAIWGSAKLVPNEADYIYLENAVLEPIE
jgi:hypothetical protein